MPDTYTDNFDLILPEPGGSVDTWGDKLNENFSRIDELIAGRASAEAIILDSGDDLFSLPSEARFYATTGSKPTNYPAGSGAAYAEMVYLTRNNGSNNAIILLDSNGEMFWTASRAGDFTPWRKTAKIVGTTLSGFNRIDGAFGVGATPDTGKDFYNASAIALGDTDSGIRGNGDGRIELWANNNERLTITSSGIAVVGAATVSGKLTAASAEFGGVKMNGAIDMTNSDLLNANRVTINDGGINEGYMLPGFGVVEDGGTLAVYRLDSDYNATGDALARWYSSGSFRAYGTIYGEGDIQKGGKSVATTEDLSNKSDLTNPGVASLSVSGGGNLNFYKGSNLVFRVNSNGRLDRAGGIDAGLLDGSANLSGLNLTGDLDMNNKSINSVNKITINDDGKGEGFMLPSFGFVEDSGRAMIVAGSTEIASFYPSGSFRAYNTIYSEGDIQKDGKSVATEEMVNNKTNLTNDAGDRIQISGSGNFDHRVDGNYVFRVNSSGRLDRADGGIDPALLDNDVGAVGTYAFLISLLGGVFIDPGDVISGSDLVYGGTSSQSTVNPPGNWRCMGCVNGSGRASLFLRVS